jgi:hypothetical protein
MRHGEAMPEEFDLVEVIEMPCSNCCLSFQIPSPPAKRLLGYCNEKVELGLSSLELVEALASYIEQFEPALFQLRHQSQDGVAVALKDTQIDIVVMADEVLLPEST